MQIVGENPLSSEYQFNQLVEQIQSDKDYREPEAFALGLARVAPDGQVLDVRYPTVNRGENAKAAAVIAAATDNFTAVDEGGFLVDPSSVGTQLAKVFNPFMHDGKRHSNISAAAAVFGATSSDKGRYEVKPVLSVIHDLEGDAPVNTSDAWFRLNLLSRRKVRPHGVNLGGVFGLMTNVAWTSEGPVLPDDVEMLQTLAISKDRQLIVRGVDKFPHMLDYVRPPEGVRVADATRVRLGAHLGEGTTVMHEGFVNFNAGTLGEAMVEGRISAGVVVGNGSDVGGGASIMGTLSGGGKEVISIGENCLLGANSGLGISLGNDCVVEAGTYVTAGKKVLLDGTDGSQRFVRAGELSGSSGLLFITNSKTGILEARRREGKKVELNPELHQQQ